MCFSLRLKKDRRERRGHHHCKQCLSPALLTLILPLDTLHFGETEWGVMKQVNFSSGDGARANRIVMSGKIPWTVTFCVSRLKHLKQSFRNFPSWFSVKCFIGS